MAAVITEDSGGSVVDVIVLLAGKIHRASIVVIASGLIDGLEKAIRCDNWLFKAVTVFEHCNGSSRIGYNAHRCYVTIYRVRVTYFSMAPTSDIAKESSS